MLSHVFIWMWSLICVFLTQVSILLCRVEVLSIKREHKVFFPLSPYPQRLDFTAGLLNATSGYQYQYGFWNLVTCFGYFLPHLSKLSYRKVIPSFRILPMLPHLAIFFQHECWEFELTFSCLYNTLLSWSWDKDLSLTHSAFLTDFYPQNELGGLCQYFSPSPPPSPTFPTHIIPWLKFQEAKVDFKL